MLQLGRPHVYGPVLKTLHWTTVAIVLALLVIGPVMTSDLAMSSQTRAGLYGLHKSLGICILFLTLLRLSWRGSHRVPALPPGLRPWEIRLVGVIHKLFYVLLLLQPLSGWAMYSVEPNKSLFFGMFRIPDLPFLTAWANSETVIEALEGVHTTLAAILTVAIVLHVGAALKHHFVIRDDVLLRMSPSVLGPLLRRLRGER